MTIARPATLAAVCLGLLTACGGGSPTTDKSAAAAAAEVVEATTTTTSAPAAAAPATVAATAATTRPAAPARRVTPPTTAAVATPGTTLAPAQVESPAPVESTTTTMAPPATVTTMPAGVQCSVTVTNPTAVKGSQQTATIGSDAPARRLRLEVQYPQFNTGKPNPRQTFELTTDESGGVTQTFAVIASSTVPAKVNVWFWNDAGDLVLDDHCATVFDAVAA